VAVNQPPGYHFYRLDVRNGVIRKKAGAIKRTLNWIFQRFFFPPHNVRHDAQHRPDFALF
jgi:hypothetical protein